MILAHGDTGAAVRRLQRQLVRAGHEIAVDGWYGDATEDAVRAEQRRHDLVVDGIAGPKTRAALAGKPLADSLRQSDLRRAADTLGVELAAVIAVNEVESRGSGFFAPRRPAILFERHIMRRRMRWHGIDTSRAERSHPNLVNARPGGYYGGLKEHDRLNRARRIHAQSALESASWGLFQIMGSHWQRLGYASADGFAEHMCSGEPAQLDAFVRFIQADDRLHAALAEHRWADFARGYNGPAYERNNYDSRLARAYERHAAVQAGV